MAIPFNLWKDQVIPSLQNKVTDKNAEIWAKQELLNPQSKIQNRELG
jgi:hypothetical protein